MPIVTLLEKAYGSHSAEAFEPLFSSLCEGLEVRLKVAGKTTRGWIQVDISGEDGAVVARFLDQEIGLAPVSVNNLGKFSVLRGRVISSETKRKDELLVDVGVFSPEICDATISLRRLQAQLADGKKLSLRKLVELYCLYENLPLQVKLVSSVGIQEGRVEAELSEVQLLQFTRWISVFLERLIVLGAKSSNVERALRVSRHARDVVKIEQLGLLELVLLCKLGTDAVGLIPRLGRYLPAATLVPFSPRELQKIVDRRAL
jgi:hypothetical protein